MLSVDFVHYNSSAQVLDKLLLLSIASSGYVVANLCRATPDYKYSSVDTANEGHMVCLDRSSISDNATQMFSAYGGQYSQLMNPDDHGTSHLSVVDAARGAVALTTTINTGFGSKVISNSTGRHSTPPTPPVSLPVNAVISCTCANFIAHCTCTGLFRQQTAL